MAQAQEGTVLEALNSDGPVEFVNSNKQRERPNRFEILEEVYIQGSEAA